MTILFFVAVVVATEANEKCTVARHGNLAVRHRIWVLTNSNLFVLDYLVSCIHCISVCSGWKRSLQQTVWRSI